MGLVECITDVKWDAYNACPQTFAGAFIRAYKVIF